jgi:putative DNA primase/helicase
MEVSTSGIGGHVLGFCQTKLIAKHRTRRDDLRLEVYTRKRFVALTGIGFVGNIFLDWTNQLQAFIAEFLPSEQAEKTAEWTTEPLWHAPGTADDEELIKRARCAKSADAMFGGKASFDDLWTANVDALMRAYPDESGTGSYNESGADQALANHLTWWTGGHCERVSSLMRQSALVRDKWDRHDYMERTILTALAMVTKNPPMARMTSNDSRPVIKLIDGNLPDIAIEAEQILGADVFVRGGSLVRIGHAANLKNETHEPHREAQQPVCISVTSEWLVRELGRRAQFFKFDARRHEWRRRDCPKDLAANIVNQGSWSNFHPLIAIAAAPFLRSDLSVCEQPGYDAMSQIYYSPSTNFPIIPVAPTRDDALAALNRLIGPFSDFPFESNQARSVFVAHVLTACVRAVLDKSPLFVYSAPLAGTGKTLLSNMAGLIATGTTPALATWPESAEELRKLLLSCLLAGDSSLMFDNVPNGVKIRSAPLCGFLTASTWGDRVLGASQVVKLPNRCAITMTGNNITPCGDLARRALVCRLDVNAESARGRDFEIPNLPSYIREHRVRLYIDALIVMRAYAFAGRPSQTRPLESFEQWSQIVREPLLWLGMTDPVESQATETDDEIAPLRAAFAAIASGTANVGHQFTAARLAEIAQGFGVVPQGNGPTLADALRAAGCAEPTNVQKLGYWLRDYRGRVAGGWKLESHKGETTKWILRAAG